jgi:HAD superfamily hydrolase (TIGR01509 family)
MAEPEGPDKLSCVVLDAMGVIFAAADDVAELLIPFVQALGGDSTKVEAAYHEASLGVIDADEFWVRVGLDASVEGQYLSRHTLIPGAHEFLVRAKEAGIPVWCLSNDVARWSQTLRTTLGIESLLCGAIISSDVRARKPDSLIYERLIERTGYRASDLLFIDDRATNVEAAARLGIRSAIFSRTSGYAQLTADVFRVGSAGKPMTSTAQVTPKFQTITPRLPVSDVEEALAFYLERLGFTLGWKWGNPLTHANACRDCIAVDLIASPTGRVGTAMAYVQIRGVDAYFAELKGRNVALSDLGDRPYGMRDFEVVDPFGNRLAFGEPL